MVRKSGWWKRFWTHGWSIVNYDTLLSGKVLVWNITLGNHGMEFMLPTLLLIFTGTTLVLLAKLGLPLSMGYHFDLSMTIRCRDVTPLKGGVDQGRERQSSV